MKLTILFFIAGLMQVSASVYSQTTRLTLEMRNSRVVDVLEEIEKQSEFRFAYSSEMIDVDRKVSVAMNEKSIDETLTALFDGTDVTYALYDRHIMLFPKGMDVAGGSGMGTISDDQQQTVSGIVTDPGNQPLPGVTVLVKGTTNGTVTNADGNYTLGNVPPDAILSFSFVGMRSQEVEVDNQSNINITLEQDVIGLDEVVAIGYGTMRKSDLTGAVVRADQEIIKERPNVSVMQSLRGALPGLNIGQTNEAGAEPDISIRGQTSLSGESAPLIVVDNIIFRGNLIDINPNDIESIDVLKDASSAAIYGSQATNGVIIITTTRKNKTLGKPVINFSSSYSFDSPAKELNLESPGEFIQRMKDADIYNSRTEESGYLEPNPDYDVTTRFRANPQIDAYRDGITTDWYNILVNENMHTQNHNLSLSNQTQNSGYYISLGFTEQVGYMHNEGYSRWNARINADNTITDWLEIGVQTFMTLSDYSGQSIPPSNIYSFHWYAPAYTPDGELEESPDGLNINPLYVFDVDDLDKRMNLFGNIYANIQIPFVKGLSFKTNYSSNYRIISKYFYQPYANSFQGSGSKTETLGNDWSNDNILSYKNTIDRIHRFDITLVYGVEKRNSSYTQATATNFVSDELGYKRLQAGSADQQSVNSGEWEEKSLYSMARLFYGLKEKYLFTGTIRRDGFSGFSEKNKFGLFPSLSVAWVMSEEKLLKESLNWLNFLKLRLSYGSNGNRTIGRYQTLARVGGGYNYIDASESSIYTQAITELASPNLKWETTTGINIGIDYSILNQRINGSIEYYNNNTKDLLYNVDIPGISRYEKFPDNLGKIYNHGLEFSINTINYETSNFQWISTFTFSRNRNELKELLGFDLDGDGKEDDLISEKLFIGEPLGTIYDYYTNGDLWQLGEEIPSYSDLGTFKIADLNDDGDIDPENDRKIIGYNDPSFRFGFNNKFKYKNLTLGIFLNSLQGSDKYYLGKDNFRSFNSPSEMLFTRTFPAGIDYWLPENQDARYQKLYIFPTIEATRYIPRSFVRLQDVSLSYDFSNQFLNKYNIESLRVFFNGKNLATWTKWTGWDPETGEGITVGGRPILKSYSFGIDVKF